MCRGIDNRLSSRTDFSLFLFHSEKIWDRDESPCNRGVHTRENKGTERDTASPGFGICQVRKSYF